MAFGLERDGSLMLPLRWHILSSPLEAGQGISAETSELDGVFPHDDLGGP